MVIIIILINLTITTNSCSDDNYSIKITNNYFETLYNINIGSLHSDTLLVNHTTNSNMIEMGKYNFTTETESGLFIKSIVDIKGNTKSINLILNNKGKLINE